jgi:hypothetical protein
VCRYVTVYESTLWFRNNDNVPRRVKVEDPKSRHFSVKRIFKKDEDEKEGGGTGKVAPGMEVAYKVFFSPADKEDYSLDLVVGLALYMLFCSQNTPESKYRLMAASMTGQPSQYDSQASMTASMTAM